MCEMMFNENEKYAWLLKDLKARCHNLQNKITPYEVKETYLNARARNFMKDYKLNEIGGWEMLLSTLKTELRRKEGKDNGTT